jgi:hypothetical protein
MGLIRINRKRRHSSGLEMHGQIMLSAVMIAKRHDFKEWFKK